MKRIAIVGGTGLLGQAVVQALHAHPNLFTLTIISRSPPSHPPLPGVSYRSLDSYTAEPDSPFVLALRGHDVLVSTVGGPVAPTVDRILLAATLSAQIPHFLPSEYTLDITHPSALRLSSKNLIGQRAAFAAHLAAVAAEGSISYTTLVVGGFLDLGLRTGLLGFDLEGRKAVLYNGGTERCSGSSVQFVAEAVRVLLMLKDEEVKNRRVNAVEIEYTGKELLGVVKEVVGGTWSVEHVAGEELVRRGTVASAEGKAREAYLNFIVKLNFDGEGAALLKDGLRFGEELEVCLKRHSLEDILKEVAGDIEGAVVV